MICSISRKFAWTALCAIALCCSAAAEPAPAAKATIQFRTEQAGLVSINIYGPDGVLVRSLLSNESLPAGEHTIPWDCKSVPPMGGGTDVPPGEYTWRGLVHERIGLKMRGTVASGVGSARPAKNSHDGWGGDLGVPSAVTADDQRVYLGWSLARDGQSVVGCDLQGHPLWSHRRSEGASGCKALAVDDGMVFVLGGLAGTDADGGAIYRLSVKDGKPIPWPGSSVDLKISSLWPADSRAKPDTADAIAVRHGHIYLSFTSSQFLTVLDAKTGAYLQTVVGAAPGMIDVAPTKSELPDAPGKLSDADFGVISLGGGVLGRILFAHDPFWVITSDLAPLDRDVNISALTVIGDGAKFHMHTAFVGFGAPFHQVQARPLLDMDNSTWVAGRAGGRALLGPWQADGLRSIRGVALAADGRLWVAESDGFPKRFSVWDTTGQEGKLVQEIIGPANPGAVDAAIDPLDGDILFAQGCEWRIDRETGNAVCLGVVTRESVDTARFGVGENGHAYLVTARGHETPALSVFERLGDGDYRLRARLFPADQQGRELVDPAKGEGTQTIFWADENGDGKPDPAELHAVPEVIHFRPNWTSQDLSLQGTTEGASWQAWRFQVRDWTGCGAPRYDGARTVVPNEGGEISADGKLVLGVTVPESLPVLICRRLTDGREMWKAPLSDAPIGSALLPEPLGNVWILPTGKSEWHLLNADGFDLGWLAGDTVAKVHPSEAMLSNGVAGHVPPDFGGGSVTHTVDGKLLLQSGDAGYWNMEVTGLDKVQALPGGKIQVPAGK